MSMIRKKCTGDYQVGIYRVTRLLNIGKKDQPWEVEDRNGNILYCFATLGEAYEHLTGEPLRQAKETVA